MRWTSGRGLRTVADPVVMRMRLPNVSDIELPTEVEDDGTS
ncbi:MAG: hypothetical protein WBA87_16910 [Microbacterium sp.]